MHNIDPRIITFDSMMALRNILHHHHHPPGGNSPASSGYKYTTEVLPSHGTHAAPPTNQATYKTDGGAHQQREQVIIIRHAGAALMVRMAEGGAGG